jgi:hypothetical protein
MCVNKAACSEAQLSSVQAALTNALPGTVSSGPDPTARQFVFDLLVATKERQRELDDRFGEDTVRLQGLLVPIDWILLHLRVTLARHTCHIG